ncbi:phospholipid phosphatase 1 isoform X3 [Anabrus simplex]|uniref:phospholipid phosphatase 1 isoform X3 n=1 Tax=Anabrus simplex TaxID=316456 RepID=UPI0034DD117D
MKACTISSNHSCARTQAPDETISLVKFFADITIIILLGIAILLLALYATPFRRGFFCDDDSIRFPHKQNTIPSALVGVAALGLPIIVITMSELVVYRIDPERRRSKTFFKWAVPLWIRRWCHAVSVFLFGAAVTKLLVDSAKYTLGRLRPHFLNVCLPDVDCNKPDITQHDYIDNYECTGSDMELIKDARMSFPSGHAALAFYSATFTIICAAGDLNADWCCMWCSPCEKTYAFSEHGPGSIDRECYDGVEDGSPANTASPSRQ